MNLAQELSDTFVMPIRQAFSQFAGQHFGWTARRLKLALGVNSLEGIDLSEKGDIIGLDKEGRVDLSGAKLKREQLGRTNFFRVNLTDADLRETTPTGNFKGALTIRTRFSRANLYNARNLTEEQLKASAQPEYLALPKQILQERSAASKSAITVNALE